MTSSAHLLDTFLKSGESCDLESKIKWLLSRLCTGKTFCYIVACTKTQYRQEILVFELMKTASLKNDIWRYQVDDIKFQPLD